jgi:hypothetical protein
MRHKEIVGLKIYFEMKVFIIIIILVQRMYYNRLVGSLQIQIP